jgi:predicted phage-related endonuclease
MRTSHNLIQGENSWHSYRLEHFGASEASSMLGLSPYKSRTQLLDEKKTGLVPEVNHVTQAIFNKGHEVEKLARVVVEKMLGEELSPVTYSFGKLSASCDGLNFMGDIAWETKQFNAAHYKEVKNGELPEIHWPQCQQIIYVTGAEKLLFTISDGTEENTASVWVYPNKVQEQHLVEGWAQFERDLETHVPTVSIEQPKAQAIIALPALFIQAKGEITTNNMKEYGEALAKRLNDVRSIALVTDQDFADAKSAAKHLRDGIEQAKLAKEAMLSQTVTVGEAARMIDTWCEDMRVTALKLEKDVIAQDLVKKQAMIECAQMAFKNMSNALEKDTAPIRLNLVMPNFGEAVKGKSRYDKMQDAISTLVANSTIAANQVANDVRSKQTWFKEYAAGYEMLFADLQSIIFKATDDFDLLVKSRIETHKKVEAEREAKIKADAEATALASIEADRLAKEKAEQAEVLAANEEAQKVAFSEVVKTGSSALLTTVDEAGTVKISPVELRAVVVEKQDAISSFLKSRDFGSEENKVRAILVEFLKHQANFDMQKAA